MLSEELQGKLHLSHTQSNKEEDFFTLRLTDVKSRCGVVEVKIPMDQMGNMISGMTTEVSFIHNTSEEIGKKHEIENRKFYIPAAFQGSLRNESIWKSFQDAGEVLLDNENKGWKLRRVPSMNHHYLKSDEVGPYYQFSVERYT